jgi:hypothetical protein
MFLTAVRGICLPSYLSSDHAPLYRLCHWQSNLRMLEVVEIKTVPGVPLSHPFVERLIGTIWRQYLDRILFWSLADLEAKLIDFQHYFTAHRTQAGIAGRLLELDSDRSASPIHLRFYRWRNHCRGLFQTPMAASVTNSPGTGLCRRDSEAKLFTEQ